MPDRARTARRATLDDVPVLARVLARAFIDDPVAIWACKPDDLRFGVIERFQTARMRQLLREREVWTTPELSSCAMWAPPCNWKTTWRQDLTLARLGLHPRMIARGPLVVAGKFGLEHRHPKDPPHWYLAMLGTDPEAQGKGFGSAVLGPVLEQCDIDGIGAFLESSKERNIDFYARHGFRVTAELRMPRGPKLWAMWRDPRP